MEVTISLSDKIFANVANVANKTHRRVDEFIAKKIEREYSMEERPLANCSDDEVLAIANSKMSKKENKRMSELLYKNQADTITPLERNELESMLFVYQVGNLRKSQGIAEAVLRGLIKSPEDLK